MSDTAIYRRQQRRQAFVAAAAARNALSGLVAFSLPTVPETAVAATPAALTRDALTTAA